MDDILNLAKDIPLTINQAETLYSGTENKADIRSFEEPRGERPETIYK